MSLLLHCCDTVVTLLLYSCYTIFALCHAAVTQTRGSIVAMLLLHLSYFATLLLQRFGIVLLHCAHAIIMCCYVLSRCF
jgi:hypothetical protein